MTDNAKQYRHTDTKRPDGLYVWWRMLKPHDPDATPKDYLFQDEDYREQDEARMRAWEAGEWGFIGVQAEATLLLVRNGVGTTYTLTSPGLWGIEDDSGEDYLKSVYEEEKATLREDIQALGTLPMQEVED